MKRILIMLTFMFAINTAQSQSKDKIETATIKTEIFLEIGSILLLIKFIKNNNFFKFHISQAIIKIHSI